MVLEYFKLGKKSYGINSNHKLYFWIILIMIPSFANAQYDKNQLPKSYIAYQSLEKLNIDGKADEASWEKSKWTDDFIDIEGVKIPKYRTRAKMMYDDTYFYFYAELEEPHIWGDITERDAVIFYNNDFEIFIDPDSDAHNYYEYEMNVLNTVWDLFLTKPYRDHGRVLNNWDINGLKSAVAVVGTINDPSDIDKKWSVEIAMPWKVLTEASGSKKIPKGKTWRINFSRVNWDFELINGKYQRKKDIKTNKYLPEYNWVWSPQGVINMHQPEKWGFVYFSPKSVGEKDTFTYDKDTELRLKMYELYRIQRKYYNDHERWNQSLIPENILIKNKEIKLNFEMTAIGYNLIVKSPFTGDKLIISQDGKLIKHSK